MTMPPDQMNQPHGPSGNPQQDSAHSVGSPIFYEEGAATENPPDDTSTPFPHLPPGVHPLDPSHQGAHDPSVVRPDTFGSRAHTTGRPPFGQTPAQSLPVYQRSDSDWTGNLYVPNSTSNSGVVNVCGRQKGRHSVRLWVPAKVLIGGVLTNTPQGVVIAPTEAEAINALSEIVLNPGDPILTLETEASVYAGVIPGFNIGYVQVALTFNPPGGGLGGQ